MNRRSGIIGRKNSKIRLITEILPGLTIQIELQPVILGYRIGLTQSLLLIFEMEMLLNSSVSLIELLFLFREAIVNTSIQNLCPVVFMNNFVWRTFSEKIFHIVVKAQQFSHLIHVE